MRLHSLLLGLSAGVLGIFALRLPYGWPIIFVALVPLLYASQKISVKNAAVAGAIAGVCISGAGSWWLFETLPLPSSYGVTVWEGFGLVFASWCIATIATGVWMGAWAATLSHMRLDRTWRIAAAGIFFLFSEFLSLVAYNIVTASPGVANPLFYSAGFVGYALADNTSFLQAAAWGGIWALSGIVIAVNLLLYFFLQQPKKRARWNIALFAIVLLLITVVPLASLRERIEKKPTATVMVGFMSVGVRTRDTPPQYSSQEREIKLDLDALVRIAGTPAQIALVPEDARVFAPIGEHRISDVIASSTLTVIHSGPYALPGERALAGYASTETGDTWLRNKLVLAPQGEYLPALFSGMLHLVGAGSAADQFSKTHALTSGEIGNTAVAGPARAALLFCSELLTPDLAKNMVTAQHANLLLFASSHSLFSGTGALETDILRFARVQTVEAGVPSVSSVVNGTAYALDRYGRITASVTAEKNTVAVSIAKVAVTK